MSKRRRRRNDALTAEFQEAFYDLKADFRMGRDSRFHSKLSGHQPMGSGADYHIRMEYQWLHMLERARYYRREDQIVGQAVRRLVANVIQEGFNLDVVTGDPELDMDLKARWKEWSEDPDQCHSEQEFDFHQIERMTFDEQITDGDIFHLPLREGSLQPIEAHRCRTPRNTTRNVVRGILLDKRARRREYWFTKEDLDPNRAFNRVSDARQISARDSQGHRQVFHIYDAYRFSQRRGISAFAPVSHTIGSHDDVQFATLLKQQLGALIAILKERTAEWEPLPDTQNNQTGDRTTETLSGGYTRTIDGMSAGLEIASDKGEKISMFSADVPGPQFTEHTMLLLTFIAINLDLPVHVLLLDPMKTNFSGWRGAIDQARQRWIQIQKHLRTKFHTPVYRWKVRQWMATDHVLRAAAERSDVMIFGHAWHPPRWPYIEPLKDAAAEELQDQKLLNSKRRIHAHRGSDWDQVAAEIVEDNVSIIELAIQAADLLNGKYPSAKLDWREVLRLPVADTVTASYSMDDEQASGGRESPERAA